MQGLYNFKHMVTKKSWEEFRETGLVLFINNILHVFGWALVFEFDGDEIKSVYPARVKFRGFSGDDSSESHAKIAKYLKSEINEIEKQATS